jgi:hypothetical protein
MRRLLLASAILLLSPVTLHAQTCTSPHYRWAEKTDLSLAVQTAHRTSVGTVLGRWSVPDFTGQAVYRCAPRETRHEDTVYSLLGWVRRIRKGESDGDWHIELTAREDEPVNDCMVVEIPDPQYGAQYGAARAVLDSLLAGSELSSAGDVTPPVRLRFIGAAFFDGEHRGGAGHRDRTDGAHGRCNRSVRALWELHPVYWVVGQAP